MTAIFVYAGPSKPSYAMELSSRSEIHLLPPAKRGDIHAAMSHHEPAVLLLADGLFDQALAVSHRELLDAIDAGWVVYGSTSMGAIRACELESLGMRACGSAVRYLKDTGAPDDHLAVTHLPAPGYRIVSESVFDIYESLRQADELDMRVEQFCDAASELPFHERTPTMLRRLSPSANITHLMERLWSGELIRPKVRDLAECLEKVVDEHC